MGLVCFLRIRLEGVIWLQKSQDLPWVDVGSAERLEFEEWRLWIVFRLRRTRPLFIYPFSESHWSVLCQGLVLHQADLVLTREIRNALPGAVSQIWISLRVLWPVYSERFSLCSPAHSNRQKSSAHPSFYTGVSARNSSFNTAIEATQIQQADSTQWLLLGLGTKGSGLSSLHTTANAALCHLLESLSFLGTGPHVLFTQMPLSRDSWEHWSFFSPNLVTWGNLVIQRSG